MTLSNSCFVRLALLFTLCFAVVRRDPPRLPHGQAWTKQNTSGRLVILVPSFAYYQTSYFKFDDVNIDNWTFKLFYKASMALCMTGATVGIASQYFGDPIRWEAGNKLGLFDFTFMSD